MEESLIAKDIEEKPERLITWQTWSQEVKRIVYIAGPVIPVLSSQFFLQIVAIMIAGHLDELSLSGTALAISIATVTGFSFLVGMASGLETLCGQAYGAKQKIHNLACSFTFGSAFLQPLIKYYQMQSLVLPLLISSCTTLILYVPLCWALVFKSGLNNVGAAVAISVWIWTNVIVLSLYMKFSSACALTRAPISVELFRGIGEFLRFAVPSAVMMCLEWWSFELIVLLSWLLPNPQLETSFYLYVSTPSLHSILFFMELAQGQVQGSQMN
ncbi:hypothetical protein K1719_008795 [Acacia pycnantha]|nr:hypothetical protein K1719_008795 [Acacia pycnantha]